jgi:hypothetical protein
MQNMISNQIARFKLGISAMLPPEVQNLLSVSLAVLEIDGECHIIVILTHVPNFVTSAAVSSVPGNGKRRKVSSSSAWRFFVAETAWMSPTLCGNDEQEKVGNHRETNWKLREIELSNKVKSYATNSETGDSSDDGDFFFTTGRGCFTRMET